MKSSDKKRVDTELFSNAYYIMDTSTPRSPITNDNYTISGNSKKDTKANLQRGLASADDVAQIIGKRPDTMPTSGYGKKPVATIGSPATQDGELNPGAPRIVVNQPDNNSQALREANNTKRDERNRKIISNYKQENNVDQQPLSNFRRTIQSIQHNRNQTSSIQKASSNLYNISARNIPRNMDWRSYDQYGGENQTEATAMFNMALATDLVSLSKLRGGLSKDLSSKSFDGTLMGRILSGGSEESQGFSQAALKNFMVNPEQYIAFMKAYDNNFDESSIMDLWGVYYNQAQNTYGKDSSYMKEIDAGRQETLERIAADKVGQMFGGAYEQMKNFGSSLGKNLPALLEASKNRDIISRWRNPGVSYDQTIYGQMATNYPQILKSLAMSQGSTDANQLISDQINNLSQENIQNMQLDDRSKSLLSNMSSLLRGSGSGQTLYDRAMHGGLEDKSSLLYRGMGWNWSIQQGGGDNKINENEMGFVEENGTKRATERLQSNVKFAYDDKYFQNIVDQSEMNPQLAAALRMIVRQQLNKDINPDQLKNLINQNTEQGKQNQDYSNALLSLQEENKSQQVMKAFGINPSELGGTSSDMMKDLTSDIGKSLQQMGGANLDTTQENLFQKSGGQVNQFNRGYIIDEKTGTRLPTDRQQLENRLLVDPKAREYYARMSGINPAYIEKWAANQWNINAKTFGEKWVRERAAQAAQLNEPGRYSEDDMRNLDAQQVTYESLRNYSSESQIRNAQNREQYNQQIKRWQESINYRRSLAQYDVNFADDVESITSDPVEQQKILDRRQQTIELQDMSDTTLFDKMQQADREKPLRDAARAKAREDEATRAEGEKIAASMEENDEFTGDPFNKGVKFERKGKAPEIKTKQENDEYTQAAIKNFENAGISYQMGLERNETAQNADLGPVDETKPGWVIENGIIRETKAQVVMDQMAAAPDTMPENVSDMAKIGIGHARDRALYNARRKQNEGNQEALYEAEQQQEELDSMTINMNDEISEVDVSIKEARGRRQKVEDESEYYLAHAGRISGKALHFRKPGGGVTKTPIGGGGDDEDEQDTITLPTPQAPIPSEDEKNITKIPEDQTTQAPLTSSILSSNIPTSMSSDAGALNREDSLINGTSARSLDSIAEIEMDRGGKDTIVTASGRTISGSAAAEILQQQQQKEVADHIQEYIDQKIAENNDFFSTGMIDEMNNIATNVSSNTVNKACEGL